MAVLKGGSGVRKNYGVSEVLDMGVVGKGWLQKRLAGHVGELGHKTCCQFDVNVGTKEMTRAVDAVF